MHHAILHDMKKSDSSRRSVQRYRDRMRRAGLRLVQLWVPDARAAGFAEECRRQSRRVAANSQSEAEVMAWIEKTRDTEGWTS